MSFLPVNNAWTVGEHGNNGNIIILFFNTVFRLRFGSYRDGTKFGEGEQQAVAGGGQEASLFQGRTRRVSGMFG